MNDSPNEHSAEQRARERAKDLTDLVWHIGTYVIINAFLWFIDVWGGAGLDWAPWVTIAWGLGVGFHVLTFIVEGRQLEERKFAQYLEEERRRDVETR